jgi:hypothetical protein
MTDTVQETFTALSDAERGTYALLADLLIPADEDLPSATGAEVPTRWIDEALRVRPDLIEELRSAISLAAGSDAQAAIETLHRSNPDAFDALGTLTAGAYFMNPEVRRMIGYPGQVGIPVREDVDTYIDMLANVVERGQVYRDVPAS